MKIIDIQRFINKIKLISEAVTLPQIRRGILGKEREYPIVDNEKEWYEDHKEEILSTIEKALNVEDKTLKIKLQKFDTDDFFTDDKPRKLKVRELLKAVRRNFISQVERSRNTEEKTSGIEAQYEMSKMGNGVEVYAVYTPMANRYLTHSKLWVQGCFSPTWCIASSSANNYWNTYHLYEAEYPSVFIVAQKKRNTYSSIKYELKCDPHKSVSFKDGKITLDEWVDEWREPQQKEKTYKNTSLFKYFNISLEDLQNTIRKLLNSKKSSTFSKNFGKEMLNLYTEKINSEDENTKMEYLTKACKNGTFINFCGKIDKEDKDYFLDELIRYGTLTEIEVQVMRFQNNKKALLYLTKNGRCTHKSLEWANRYFDNNMVRKVYHSLPDDILSSEVFEGINVRKEIFNNIKKDKGLTEEFVNYLISIHKFNNSTLDYVRFDEEILRKCVDNLISKNRVDEYTLQYVIFDEESLRKCVNYLISKNRITSLSILDYAKFDKESLRKCVEYIISKNSVTDKVLQYVERDEDLSRECVDNLILNNRVDDYTLYSIGHGLKNREELERKCIEHLISKNRIYNRILPYVSFDEDLLKKCVDILISNNDVDNDTIKYARRDEESLRKCVEYLISKNEINKKTLSELFSWDDNTSMIKKVLIYLIDKNRDFEIYRTIENGKKFYEKDIATLCKILDEREMNDVLRSLLSYGDSYDNYYIRLYEEILKRCSILTKLISCSMLFAREKNLRINDTLNTTFKNAKDDERLLKSLVGCFISSGYKSYFDKALNNDYEGRYALYYLIDCLENDVRGDYFEKCIENIENFENTYEDFVSFLKQNKEYSERAESWLRYPLFGETEEKDKIAQMKNLYKLFERKYKENGRKSNEEIANIIREMIDIGFYQRIKTSYRPIVALVDGDDIPEDNVKMIEEILKQIGEENYNDRLLNYMTWNKKFYKFIPHIVDVLISKNDIGTSLEDVINDDGITDVNSAKKLANWIIKNKNTIDKDTKVSLNYVKENHPEIYKELFGDKL